MRYEITDMGIIPVNDEASIDADDRRWGKLGSAVVRFDELSALAESIKEESHEASCALAQFADDIRAAIARETIAKEQAKSLLAEHGTNSVYAFTAERHRYCARTLERLLGLFVVDEELNIV